MVTIQCFEIVDDKEVKRFKRSENKFTKERFEKGEYPNFVGPRGSHWKYVKYDEKNLKAIIVKVEA